MAEEGKEGNFAEGKFFQKTGGGGRTYDGRIGISSHLTVWAGTGGAGGKKIFFFGSIQSSTVDHVFGIPIFSLPFPDNLAHKKTWKDIRYHIL